MLGFGAAISRLNWVYVCLSWQPANPISHIPLIGGVCLLIGVPLITVSVRSRTGPARPVIVGERVTAWAAA